MPSHYHFNSSFESGAPLDDEKLWDLLSLYVDGEADPAQAEIVEHMLSSDPAYRRDFDFLMKSSQTMHSFEEIAPPEGLRDSIYASTLRRPTPFDRVRMAWERATAPGLGRMASVGGACAAAVIGILVLLPRLAPSPNNPRTDTRTVAAAAGHPDAVHAASPLPTVPNLNIKPVHSVAELDTRSAPRKPVFHRSLNAVRVVASGPAVRRIAHSAATVAAVGAELRPRIYHLKKSPQPHSDGLMVAATAGYPYNRKMDNNVAHASSQTIMPGGSDFGPALASNDDATTAGSHTGDVTTAARDNTQDAAQPVAQPAPRPIVHVATLPPGASQNIAAAVIRHDINARYSGYDRSVAENIQRHEVTINVIKGTF